MGLDLWVVHVTAPWPRSAGDVTSLSSRRARVRAVKNAVQQWSLFELGLALPAKYILVCFGDPAEKLHHATRHLRAELLVLGGRTDAAADAPGALTEAVLARSSCPVLVAGPVRDGRAMVVATDLERPNVPVVRVAASLARQLRRPLTVVHNVDGVALHGVVYALPDGLEREVMAARLQTLGGVVRGIESVDDATVTREALAGDGILQVARARDVDLLVVGARPDVGLTSKHILAEARRSVLVVPLPA